MALKRTALFLLAAAVLVAAAVGFYYVRSYKTAPMDKPITSVNFGTDSTSSPQATVKVEVADTEAAREQGLSDRAGLPPNNGMLFVFDSPAEPGFWMKDMQFSLDMIFIDETGKVVTIDSNLSPTTYNAVDPNSSQVFRPSAPIIYVLEVPAGYAAAHGIVVGSIATFR